MTQLVLASLWLQQAGSALWMESAGQWTPVVATGQN